MRSWRERGASEIEASALILIQGSDFFEKLEGYVELSEAILLGKRTVREAFIASVENGLFEEGDLEVPFMAVDLEESFCILDSLFSFTERAFDFSSPHGSLEGLIAELDSFTDGFFDIKEHG